MDLIEALKCMGKAQAHTVAADSVSAGVRAALLELALVEGSQDGLRMTLTVKGERQARFWESKGPPEPYWMLDGSEGHPAIFHALPSYADARAYKPALCGYLMIEASDFVRPGVGGPAKCAECERRVKDRGLAFEVPGP